MSLQDFFDKFEDDCHPIEPVTFSWASKGSGFGQMYFYVNKDDGYVHCENETMGRGFLKRMLCQMVDNCVLDCPGSWDEESEGKPPGYNPEPIKDDSDIGQ